MNINDAVKFLTATYMPFDVAVRGMVLEAKEVTDALSDAVVGSEEHTVLKYLASVFPYAPTEKESKTT